MEENFKIEIGGKILSVIDILEFLQGEKRYLNILINFDDVHESPFRIGYNKINNKWYMLTEIRMLRGCYEIFGYEIVGELVLTNPKLHAN
jgi:hypothetical protein